MYAKFHFRRKSGSLGMQKICFRQHLHETGSVWNTRYEIGTDKSCVYMGPGGSGMDRICYLVPNGSTYEGDPMWNRTVQVLNRSRVSRVDPIPNGSEHIRSRVNVALIMSFPTRTTSETTS